MSGIVEFLLARIAEEEALAHKVAERMEHAPPTTPGGIGDLGIVGYPFACVLAECQAKRAIIEEHREEVGYVVAYRESDRLIAEGYNLHSVPLQASAAMIPACLRHLAAVYADHPDYREEWRP